MYNNVHNIKQACTHLHMSAYVHMYIRVYVRRIQVFVYLNQKVYACTLYIDRYIYMKPEIDTHIHIFVTYYIYIYIYMYICIYISKCLTANPATVLGQGGRRHCEHGLKVQCGL